MKMKKVKAVLAALTLAALLPFQTLAADGSIMFSDLTEETGRSVKTGDTAEVKFAVAASAGAIGEASVTLTYDASALQFEGAEGVTEGSEKGTLIYTGKGDGTAAELRTTLKFKVLKAGDLSIQVASYQVTSSEGTELAEVEAGSSAITALQGEQIPAEGAEQDPEEGSKGDMIEISDTYKITLLTEKPDQELSDNYVDTELTLNGQTYPVWQDEDKSSYYIVYAENSEGEKQLYQYDSKEGTYQRFIAPEAEKEDASGIKGKIKNFLEGHLMQSVIGVTAIVGFLLLMVLILAVKLHRRNRELDEMEMFGMPEDEEEFEDRPVLRGKKRRHQEAVEEEFDDPGEEDDYEDADYDDDEYDEAYEEEDLYEDDYEDDLYEEDYEDDFDEEDYEDEDDDRSKTFSMDFIDLD
nr:cohesin domain-containing protein [uncultured Faecalimonas sp.]